MKRLFVCAGLVFLLSFEFALGDVRDGNAFREDQERQDLERRESERQDPDAHLALTASSESIEELVVYGRAAEQLGVATAASSGQVGEADIQLVARMRVGELVEAVPGMVATQHSGTGKANQYYLRGFNLDHGTDFAAYAEGVPLNMRTHGHGQGYLDLNFLIPEMISTTRYRKGPYHAAGGDFSSAGSVEFLFYDRLPHSLLTSVLGEDGYRRGVLAGSTNTGPGVFTGAVAHTRRDGPWLQPEDLTQDKVQLRYVTPLAQGQAFVDAQFYRGRWTATDQIPERAVRSGHLDALGFIDPDLGGRTDRWAVTAGVDATHWSANVFAIGYDFQLFSNFTYFLNDPIRGDEFEQVDRRRVYGLNLEGAHESLAQPIVLQWGLQSRFDDIDELGLYGTEGRRRHTRVRADMVREGSVGLYGDLEIELTHRLRSRLGLRGDFYTWDVDAAQVENVGAGSETRFSPKLSLAYRLSDALEAYGNWGRGFHSNDVRGATFEPGPQQARRRSAVLAGTQGAELGIRFERERRFNASFTVFRLDVDSELVFVGDAGGTEAQEASRRTGLEAALYWRLSSWWSLDASYTFTDASFRGSQEPIPGAIATTGSLGLSFTPAAEFSAYVRMRYLGSATLTADKSQRTKSSNLVHAGFSYQLGAFGLGLDVFNLFNTTAADVSYFYASRLSHEALSGFEDVHGHPLEPRTVRATLTWRPGAAGD
ncbi:MAG: TonB-dependent receptor [Pseudomonadota bacterium]